MLLLLFSIGRVEEVGIAEFFEWAGGGEGVVVWSNGPLLVAVVGGGVWKMLAGKGGWRKRLYGRFGVYGRCMDRVVKGLFLL